MWLAIFFLGVLVVGMLVGCGTLTWSRGFNGAVGAYVMQLMAPTRDRYQNLAVIWYCVLMLVPVIRVIEGLKNPSVPFLVLAGFSFFAGAFAALGVGDIIGIKVFNARVREQNELADAKKKFFDEAAARQASPQLVGGEVTFNPAGARPAQEVGRFGNVSIQQAPSEGVFAFDPAKFKG